VFWKSSTNNQVWEAVWNNGWHGPTTVPGINNAASSPTVVVNTHHNEEDLFWKGTDGTLWEEEWFGNTRQWSGAHQIANMGLQG
jgi:hypothetical protein